MEERAPSDAGRVRKMGRRSNLLRKGLKGIRELSRHARPDRYRTEETRRPTDGLEVYQSGRSPSFSAVVSYS